MKLCKPDFLALHLQEVGGKTYEKSMEYVQQFIKILCESNELSEYNKIRVFLDEDFNSAEHFTVSNANNYNDKAQYEWSCWSKNITFSALSY